MELSRRKILHVNVTDHPKPMPDANVKWEQSDGSAWISSSR
jgi:hypothetical protein